MRRNLFLGIMLAPYRVDFCNYLHDHFNCEIYYLHCSLDDSCFDQAYFRSLCRYEMKFTPTFSFLGRKLVRISWLNRLLKECDPEYVFVPEFSFTTLVVLLLNRLSGRRFRVVSVCDDNMDMIGGNDFSRLHTLARRFVPRYLDNLVLVNRDTTRWYREHFGKGVCFPIIADEKRLRRILEQALPRASEWISDLGLEHRSVVLFVGRLVDVKNLDRLLEAMPLVQGAPALVVVGDGVLRTVLEDKCRALALRNVFFTGKLTGLDLMAWYDLADVLVLPSTREAFGAVVNEALVAGCPVAVSSHAGASDLIRSRDAGIVFRPDSVESIADALNTLLERPSSERPPFLRNSLMPMEFLPALEAALSQLNR